MDKKHIITIAGRPGSGKSTAARNVASELGYSHFSSGDLFRAIGKERGIDLLSANHVAEKEVDIDHLVDQKLRDIGANEDEFVIDSRMAWHWMPYSFKVYLDLDLLTAAQRILAAKDASRHDNEHVHEDPEHYAVDLQKRLDSEARRYKTLYDVNPFVLSNYDLVIDTAQYGIEDVARMILDGYRQWVAATDNEV